MLDYYLEYFLPAHLAELLAAVAGAYYLSKEVEIPKSLRLFLYFLWVTLLIDLTGLYAVHAYFTDYQYMEYLRNSPFRRNEWYFNIFNIFFLLVYMVFFIVQLNSIRTRRILILLCGFFFFSEVINLIFSGVFFVNISTYGSITGTLILVLCILSYYYEMLKSNSILYFYRDVVFYISIGVLIRYLVVPPLSIYSKYFSLTSPEFVELRANVMSMTNLFMYGMFIIGFMICSNKPLKCSSHSVENR